LTDFDVVDFFTEEALVPNPYPYFDHLRSKCPVTPATAFNVLDVTGYDAALIEAPTEGPDYPGLLRSVTEPSRFPTLASALEGGAFDNGDGSHVGQFRSGLDQLLDGISLKV
jgi:hypothetical protein